MIRLLVLDVDGVLTDGTFLLPPSGDEWKAFHARDGLGLRMLIEAGVAVALLSGRRSETVERRARELGLSAVVQGKREKREGLYELATRFGAPLPETAYMGDDLVDLPAMRAVGWPAAPADAHPDVRAAARFVSEAPGGRGAVREFCEHLLKEAGRWDEVRARFGP